jgi:hypothetical protein
VARFLRVIPGWRAAWDIAAACVAPEGISDRGRTVEYIKNHWIHSRILNPVRIGSPNRGEASTPIVLAGMVHQRH